MSDEILKGTFQTSQGNLTKVLNWTTAPFDERYDQAYLNLASDTLRTIANAGESVMTYCTFYDPFLEEIDLHDSVDENAGMEAIVNVPQMIDYLEFVEGEYITVEFYGLENERGCKKVILRGNLTAELNIPASKSDYQSKQLGVVNLYDDQDQFVKSSNGKPLSTSFTTHTDQFQKIVQVTEFEDLVLSNYPVVIENGDFLLEASDENQRNRISGKLEAKAVDGPDVNNTYSRGFMELFSTIDGQIDVSIEQDGPISIVRESTDDALTLRYSILPTL